MATSRPLAPSSRERSWARPATLTSTKRALPYALARTTSPSGAVPSSTKPARCARRRAAQPRRAALRNRRHWSLRNAPAAQAPISSPSSAIFRCARHRGARKPMEAFQMKKSAELFERAQRRIPGGVNSPVRAFRAVGGTPVFFERASGPHPMGRGRQALHRLRRLLGSDARRTWPPRGRRSGAGSRLTRAFLRRADGRRSSSPSSFAAACRPWSSCA